MYGNLAIYEILWNMFVRALFATYRKACNKEFTQLLCAVKPEMTNTPLTRKAAANKGISVHLYCKARGSPLPRFSWIFNRKTLSPNTTENKYSITHSDVSHFIRRTYLLNNDFLYRYISFRDTVWPKLQYCITYYKSYSPLNFKQILLW